MKTHSFNGVSHDVLIEKLDGFCFKSGWSCARPSMVVPIEVENTKKFLESVLHEATHCQFPCMSEDNVTQFAYDMSRLLWRLGYRLPDVP